MRVLAERSLVVALAAIVMARVLSACGPAHPAVPARAAARPSPTGSSAAAAPRPVASPPLNPAQPAALTLGRPCGDLDCLAFATPRLAFEHALASSPRVVAVGEAHAQQAVTGVDSATKRFARELLPALAPRVTGVVLELLAPDKRCEAHDTAAVAERTKPVTEPQRATNQNEFLALGFDAKKLGMRVEPLVPSCEELKSVLAAGNDVDALLRLIAGVTEREVFDFLDHQKPEHAILIYGGLLHNDLKPRAGHEGWSFGPAVAEHAGGSYVEIDLIVPEFIQSEPPWTELPWFSHYNRAAAPRDTLLYATGAASFVLIFPPSNGSEPVKAIQ